MTRAVASIVVALSPDPSIFSGETCREAADRSTAPCATCICRESRRSVAVSDRRAAGAGGSADLSIYFPSVGRTVTNELVVRLRLRARYRRKSRQLLTVDP